MSDNKNMTQRCHAHNYHGRGLYMVTIITAGRAKLLGKVVGNKDSEPGTPGYPICEHSKLSITFLREAIAKHRELYPMAEIWKIQVMPDHIHFIIYVKDPLPDEKDLGSIIGGFKTRGSKVWKRLRSEESGKEEPFQSLFEYEYNDKILKKPEMLGNWKRYLADNPRRYLIKYKNPTLFTVFHDREICGHKCQIVGNQFLLDIPEKMAVIVHNAYTDADFEHYKQEWLECGKQGGVLVSAAIAPREKEVMREAMELGYKVILLRENGFPQLFKPSGKSFYSCAQGLLLQICPWDFHFDRREIKRKQCLILNKLAEDIAGLQL